LQEIVFVAAASIAIVAFMFINRNSLVITLVSPDVARTAGINVRRVDLLYLVALALTIGLGLRYLCVLLMGALIRVPSVTAKRLARKLSEMLLLAVLFAVSATLLGVAIAFWLHQETGPDIALVAAGGFAITRSSRRPPLHPSRGVRPSSGHTWDLCWSHPALTCEDGLGVAPGRIAQRQLVLPRVNGFNLISVECPTARWTP
jgi:hypothetical protein